MAVQQHVDVLKRGAKKWNVWRKVNPRVRPDLSGAEFREIDLSDVNLKHANLAASDFTYTFLTEADLSDSDLTDARLIETNLVRADLRKANLRSAMLHGANLRDAKLAKATLVDAYLGAASLVTTDLRDANLTGADLTYARLIGTLVDRTVFADCAVYGISAWDLKGQPKEQRRLTVTPENEPVVAVDDLELAQFVYLLLNHKNLRRMLDSVIQRGVLILGRFGEGGLAVLREAADALRALDYLPMIFDFERPRDRNYTETVKTLVGLSRFVVVDLSGPSVPQELYATVPHFKIPFVPIIEAGRDPYALFADVLEYDWVVKPVGVFGPRQSLAATLRTSARRAEQLLKARQKQLTALFGRRR
jgi:Pentapeptide repeats (8 copies)